MLKTPPKFAITLLEHLLKQCQQQTGQRTDGTTHQAPIVELNRPLEDTSRATKDSSAAIAHVNGTGPRKRIRTDVATAEHSITTAASQAAGHGTQQPSAKRHKPVNQDKLLSNLIKSAKQHNKRTTAHHQQCPADAAHQGQRPYDAHDVHRSALASNAHQKEHTAHVDAGNMATAQANVHPDFKACGTAAAAEHSLVAVDSNALAAAADALQQALARQGSLPGLTAAPAEGAGTAGAAAAAQAEYAGAGAAGSNVDDLFDLWNAGMQEYQEQQATAAAEPPSEAAVATANAADAASPTLAVLPVAAPAAVQDSPSAAANSPADSTTVAATGGVKQAPETIKAQRDMPAAATEQGCGSSAVVAASGMAHVSNWEDAMQYHAEHLLANKLSPTAAQAGLGSHLATTSVAADAAMTPAGHMAATVCDAAADQPVASSAALQGELHQQQPHNAQQHLPQGLTVQQQPQEPPHKHVAQQHLGQHQQLCVPPQLVVAPQVQAPQQPGQYTSQMQQQVMQQQQQLQQQCQRSQPVQQQQQQGFSVGAYQQLQMPVVPQLPVALPAAAPMAALPGQVMHSKVRLVPASSSSISSSRRPFTLASLLFAVPELPIKASGHDSNMPGAVQQQTAWTAGTKQPPLGSSAKQPAAAAAGVKAIKRPNSANDSKKGGKQQQQQHKGNAARSEQQQQQQQSVVHQQHQPPHPGLQQQKQGSQHQASYAASEFPRAAAASAASSDEEGELGCSDDEPSGGRNSNEDLFEFSAVPAPAACDHPATSAAGASGGGAAVGLQRPKPKSRAGKKVRQRRAEAERAAQTGGQLKVGLYAEIKAWEKEQAAKTRNKGSTPVDPARELRFSITEKPPCKFWQAGCCVKGAACPYPHSGQPAVKLVACKFNQRGACRAGESCKFSHEALSALPCPDLALYHKCPKAPDACPYSHEALAEGVALALRRLLMKLQQSDNTEQQQPHHHHQQQQLLGMLGGVLNHPLPHHSEMIQQRHPQNTVAQLQQCQQQAGNLQQPGMVVPHGAYQHCPRPPAAPWPGFHASGGQSQFQQQSGMLPPAVVGVGQVQQRADHPSMQQWNSHLQRH